MNRARRYLAILALLVWSFTSQAGLWRTAYYAGWSRQSLPPASIDFGALTHIIDFSVVPEVDGSLDTAINALSPASSRELVTRAHAAGVKVLLSVGGADSQPGFRGAAAPANRAKFISELLKLVNEIGYDGIDLDWEPLESSDGGLYSALVQELRAALDRLARRLLTAAAASEPGLFSSLQAEFDQINVMTYDLAGPWPGWVTWFNSPLYDGGYRFPSTGEIIPSADSMISDFIDHGISPGKLGVGIAFYGTIWQGGEGTSTGGSALPRQEWTIAPSFSAISYSAIMSRYYQPDFYHWDPDAAAAYLSLNRPGSADDTFIAFDDERACQAKISYARNRGLGGVMIWELSDGFRPDATGGPKDPLLQAVKEGINTPRFVKVSRQGTSVTLSFTSLPLASYSLEVTSELNSGLWTRQMNINLPGEGVMTISDVTAAAGARTFYRLRTPP